MVFSPKGFDDFLVQELIVNTRIAFEEGGTRVAKIWDDAIDGLEISGDTNLVHIRYSQKVYLYRALSLLHDIAAVPGIIQETAAFKSNGIMLDCSRNAVPTVDTLKYVLRQMALMGLNTLMLYMEDNYEVSVFRVYARTIFRSGASRSGFLCAAIWH